MNLHWKVKVYIPLHQDGLWESLGQQNVAGWQCDSLRLRPLLSLMRFSQETWQPPQQHSHASLRGRTRSTGQAEIQESEPEVHLLAAPPILVAPVWQQLIDSRDCPVPVTSGPRGIKQVG